MPTIICSTNCEYADGCYCGLQKIHVDEGGCCEDYMPMPKPEREDG